MNDSDPDNWQKCNEEYLAAALAWLRLRLKHLAESTAGAPSLPHDTLPVKRCFVSFRRSKPDAATAPATAVSDQKEVSQAEVEAAASMAEVASAETPPALVILSQRFGLSRFEQEVLLLCAAMELDTQIAALCARAQDNPNRAYPTFALALALFDDPSWDVLSPERPLRYWHLIQINQASGQPITTSPLCADERIVSYIKGLNYLDDRMAPLLLPLEANCSPAELAPSQRSIVDTIVRHLEQAATRGEPPVIQLIGTDTLSKQLITACTAAELGLHPYRLPAELLPPQAAELDNLTRLWQRESALLPVVLYVDVHKIDGQAQPDAGASAVVPSASQLHRFLIRNTGLLFLDTREIRQTPGQTMITVNCDKPVPVEQQAAWANALKAEAGDSPALLAGQFNLNLVTIWHIARTTLAEPSSDVRTLHDRLWDACLIRTSPQLDILAERLDPKATWDDIVLPQEQKRLLQQIADQVGQRSKVYDEWGFRKRMNRGLGISALFTGESGTGKTMAVEVITNLLRLNLSRIDLSAVVSKYIGETEENLRQLFDAAEDGGAILFFDEADALFGKRSEVKDSHDRYANIEINYLLQRMESYRGLSILATNMKSAMDQAFIRRLRFIVNFPFPSQEMRKMIWEKVFPTETPVNGLDYDRLARFNLTGGSIHSIALSAAFLAAQKRSAVTMELVLEAARIEFRKLERPVNEADFRWPEPVGVTS